MTKNTPVVVPRAITITEGWEDISGESVGVGILVAAVAGGEGWTGAELMGGEVPLGVGWRDVDVKSKSVVVSVMENI